MSLSVTCRVELWAPSASLWVTPSSVVPSTPQREELPPTGTAQAREDMSRHRALAAQHPTVPWATLEAVWRGRGSSPSARPREAPPGGAPAPEGRGAAGAGPEEATGCWEAGAAPLWGQPGAGGVRPGERF